MLSFILFLVCTLFAVEVNGIVDYSGKKGVYWKADPFDCSKYYKCFNGLPIQYKCPGNFHFDLTTFQCYPPHMSKCKKLQPPIYNQRPKNSSAFNSAFKSRAGGSVGAIEEPPAPTIIKLSLYKGKTKEATLPFALGDVVVQFLICFDLSGSFQDDLDNLKALAPQLEETLKKCSTKPEIGLVSFVDKPHFDIDPVSQDYSCKFLLSMTSDFSLFITALNSAVVLNGLDIPESQFDCLCQILDCPSNSGFRANAFRIIFLATDASAHLAGQFPATAYDNLCHVDGTGTYRGDMFDYPKLEDVLLKIATSQARIIFAATLLFGAKDFYEIIAAKTDPPSTVVELNSDSSNILTIIEESCKDAKGNVKLEVPPVIPGITVQVFSSCGKDTPPIETIECLGVEGIVTFIVKITLVECPVDPKDWNPSLQYKLIGYPMIYIVKLNLKCGSHEYSSNSHEDSSHSSESNSPESHSPESHSPESHFPESHSAENSYKKYTI